VAKVALCIPTLKRPFQQCLDSVEASAPLLEQAGWEHVMVSEIGCPYVSHARATMLRKALDAKADTVVFIDHDLSWEPGDLLKLIQTPGEVVAGVYRFKRDEVEYMGQLLPALDGTPRVRDDGCVAAHSVPAGFLKITQVTVNRFMHAHPELAYGDKFSPCIDLFNHGAFEGVWYGEDYSFSRRWRALGGEIWVVPDLSLTHHGDKPYPGNFHQFLMRQPGGSEWQQQQT
jgi:glycosyltransferase involved in cell wall biosynthesis